MRAPEADAALLTVPGNLLLLGEYAVLEEGGIGIAMAVEKRLAISIVAAHELRIGGGGGRFQTAWKTSDGPAGSLVGALVAAVEDELEQRGLERKAPRLGLHIDSSAFFGSDGRKLGLGSSAAVAVGTAQALLRYSGLEARELMDASYRAALRGHRSHQGGRGSGYDVAASLHGGWGLFTGGELPHFEPLALPWLRPISLLRGGAPVDTSMAVKRYLDWRRLNPKAARGYLDASNENARGFAAARNWAEASSCLREGARLGLELGEAIGVPAKLDRLECSEGKALGAGNELAALWGENSRVTVGELEDLVVASEGPLWRN